MKDIAPAEAFSRCKPEPCVFVISVDENGRPSGMVAGWCMRCSGEPPMLAVALSKKGHTRTLIRQSKEFVVAVPNRGLEKPLLFFGSTSGRSVDKFRETGIMTAKARLVRPPLLKGATINFECKLDREIDTGDHTLFIGRVVASHVNEEKKVLMNMGKRGNERLFEEF